MKHPDAPAPELLEAVTRYLDEHYVEEVRRRLRTGLFRRKTVARPVDRPHRRAAVHEEAADEILCEETAMRPAICPPPLADHRNGAPRTDSTCAAERPVMGAACPPVDPSLADAVARLDESFSEMLLRKIDESGMTDAQCYKKAYVDRKLFSKIRGDRLYKPSKATAIAFAMALELPPDEARDLLKKAGFALSHSSKFDVIVEFFLQNRRYDIDELNEALFAFDQALIGA